MLLINYYYYYYLYLIATLQVIWCKIATHTQLKQRYPDITTANATGDWNQFELSNRLSLYWRFDLSNPISWQDGTNSSIIEFVMGSTARGWFALGLGTSNMYGADVLLVHRPTADSEYKVMDYTTLVGPNVYEDSSLPGGQDDILQQAVSVRKDSLVVSFKRKLHTADPVDFIIKPGRVPIVSSWGFDSETVQQHGPFNRRAFFIDFFRNEPGFDKVNNHLPDADFPSIKNRRTAFILVHAIAMSCIFLFMIPIGLYVARYWPDSGNWISIHQAIMSISVSQAAAAAFTTLVSGSLTLDSTHSVVGVTTAASGLIVASLGYVAKQDWIWVRRRFHLFHKSHRFLGTVFALGGIINCFIGLQWILIGFGWGILVTVISAFGWLLLCVCIIYLFHRLGGLQATVRIIERHLAKESTTSSRSSLVSVHKFPTFSRIEFKKRIKEGAKWLIVDKNIYNIEAFLDVHPGGKSVLNNYIGLDATLSFFPERARKGFTKISGHVHSRFARARLNEFLVGYYESKVDHAAFAQDDRVSTFKGKVAKFALASHDQAIERVYRVSIEMEQPVSVLPGDVFTLSPSDDQLLVRFYEPIRVMKSEVDAEFLIKIYDNGAFTSLLEQRCLKNQGGFEVNIEGPILRFPQHPIRKWENMYDRIVMISAGTGVTPMLLSLDILALNNADRLPKEGIIFVACHHSWEDAQFYQKDLARLKTQINTNFQEHYFLTRGIVDYPESVSIHSTKLRNEQDMRAFVDFDVSMTLFMICGPVQFMEKIEAILMSRFSVPGSHIHLEK